MVKLAWGAIGVALVVGFGSGFVAARWHYVQRLALAKQRLVSEGAPRKIVRGSSDYTVLTRQAKSALMSALPNMPAGCSVTVRTLATTSARGLAADFLALFSGWKTQQLEYTGDDASSKGLHFAFNPGDSWGVQFEATLETTGMHPVSVPDNRRATCDWEFTFGEPPEQVSAGETETTRTAQLEADGRPQHAAGSVNPDPP